MCNSLFVYMGIDVNIFSGTEYARGRTLRTLFWAAGFFKISSARGWALTRGGNNVTDYWLLPIFCTIIVTFPRHEHDPLGARVLSEEFM